MKRTIAVLAFAGAALASTAASAQYAYTPYGYGYGRPIDSNFNAPYGYNSNYTYGGDPYFASSANLYPSGNNAYATDYQNQSQRDRLNTN